MSLKFIPSKKIQEILNENYTRGINGKDYGPVKHELEEILWERQSKSNDHVIEAYWNDHQDFLESQKGIKKMKTEDKNNHLIKNVPDNTWLEFRIFALENKLSMAEALQNLLDNMKEDQKKKTA